MGRKFKKWSEKIVKNHWFFDNFWID